MSSYDTTDNIERYNQSKEIYRRMNDKLDIIVANYISINKKVDMVLDYLEKRNLRPKENAESQTPTPHRCDHY